MPSNELFSRLVNRTVLVVFVVELVIWGVWSVLFMRAPFGSPLIRPVMDLSAEVGQAVFGCVSLSCIPYVFAGVVIYLYAIAVAISNLYVLAEARLQAEPS